MTDSAEETLSREGVTHVVRIGQSVRRPVRPFTDTIQPYLSHVRSRGFTDGVQDRLPRAVPWLAKESEALQAAL